MAYNVPDFEQDPWYDDMVETLEYLKTTAEAAQTASGGAALKNNNLSDLANASTARDNLGLGSAAVADTGDFEVAGAAAAAEAAASQRSNHTGSQIASTISDFSTAADARITAAIGSSVQAFDSDLTTWASKTPPGGAAVGTTDTQTLTNKTISGSSNTLSSISADSTVDGTTNKVYTATEKTKLSGIATSATANSSDATLKARANHTGTQAISTVTDLQDELDLKLEEVTLVEIPAGSVLYAIKSGSWPARPTGRSDVMVVWIGADPSPSIVSSGTGGMRDGLDVRFVTP